MPYAFGLLCIAFAAIGYNIPFGALATMLAIFGLFAWRHYDGRKHGPAFYATVWIVVATLAGFGLHYVVAPDDPGRPRAHSR